MIFCLLHKIILCSLSELPIAIPGKLIYRGYDIEDLIKDKPRILVMTKYDLCDQEETNKFVSYYESLGYKVICCDLINNQNVVNKIIAESNVILKDMNESGKERLYENNRQKNGL